MKVCVTLGLTKKEVEKAEKEGKDAPEPELKERLKAADELEKTLKKEKKSGKVENSRLASEDKCLEALKKIEVRIEAQRTEAVNKEEGKDTALSTSKINYLDPRITYVTPIVVAEGPVRC